jgi:predicted dehydrogenase
VIGVGMVGLGLAAAAHVKGYASHAGARLVAVCDLDRGRAERFAGEHDIERVFTDYGEMLGQGDIDLIDIATPTHLHVPMSLAALDAGKHVHCEKPFCRSVAEGEAVVALACERGLTVMVGETYVFHTSHAKARALIEGGAIGRPLQIRQRHGAWLARDDAAIHTGPAERNWRVDPALSGGGAYPWIFDHAVHFFAAAEYFALGQPIAEVYAVTSRFPDRPRQSGAAHDPYITAEVDIPIITFKFADPAVQGVWMRAERLNGKYDYMHGFSTTIIGEHGMIEVLGEGGGNLIWQGEPQHLLVHQDGEPTRAFRFDEGGDDVWQSEISYYSQGHINQVHHLIDCLAENKTPRYTAVDGVRAVRCTLAAIQSAETGVPVKVEALAADYTAYGTAPA